MAVEPCHQETANERTGEETEQRGDRGQQGEARRTGQRKPDERDVACHVGHEDPTEAKDADRINESGHGGQDQQQGRKRPVGWITDEGSPERYRLVGVDRCHGKSSRERIDCRHGFDIDATTRFLLWRTVLSLGG